MFYRYQFVGAVPAPTSSASGMSAEAAAKAAEDAKAAAEAALKDAEEAKMAAQKQEEEAKKREAEIKELEEQVKAAKEKAEASAKKAGEDAAAAYELEQKLAGLGFDLSRQRGAQTRHAHNLALPIPARTHSSLSLHPLSPKLHHAAQWLVDHANFASTHQPVVIQIKT